MIGLDRFGYLYPALIGGESWRHFVQNKLYVPETSPEKSLKGSHRAREVLSRP